MNHFIERNLFKPLQFQRTEPKIQKQTEEPVVAEIAANPSNLTPTEQLNINANALEFNGLQNQLNIDANALEIIGLQNQFNVGQIVRTGKANSIINSFAEQLKELPGAEEKFKAAVEDIKTQFINDEITENEFTTQVEDKFNEVKQGYEALSDEVLEIDPNVGNKINTASSSYRTDNADSIINEYTQELQKLQSILPNAVDNFMSSVSDLKEQYINGEITENEFKAQVENKFNEIKTTTDALKNQFANKFAKLKMNTQFHQY